MCIRDRATRANLSELQVKEIIPTLTIAPDITKVVLPQGCGYLILDKNFNELYSNMDDDEKEIALLYAKGEYIEYATGRQFALVVRENEFCVLRYYIGSQFTVSWLPEYFPSPDTLVSVSYTHLDVYKRQMGNSSLPFRNRLITHT